MKEKTSLRLAAQHLCLAALMLTALSPCRGWAQEVLVPAGRIIPAEPRPKNTSPLSLPFFDDFSSYTGAPSALLWADTHASVGNGFSLLPPTVGVLSLDALDANGCLHAAAATSAFPADTATSLPIRLDGMGRADSVVFSFFYIPAGGGANPWEQVGDAPNARDSLFLDFYSTADSSWQTVWSRGGTSVAELMRQTGHAWQYVAIKIEDERWMDSLFRFRFRNLCSLEDIGVEGWCGNTDQWDIDYVLLDRGRTADSLPSFRDLAFAAPAPTALKHYRAMPARQYRTSDMAEEFALSIANLYAYPMASHYGYTIFSADGSPLHTYDGGFQNAPPDTLQSEPAHAHPRLNFSFEESSEPRQYTIEHTLSAGTAGDLHRENDTIRFTQTFADYYAYDDGTAENGYGLNSTASRVMLAYRFDLNQADTLTAIDIGFNQTFAASNAAIRFYLTVWRNEEGRPGSILYSDSEARTPLFPDSASRQNGHGAFRRYVLEREVPVSGSIFIGFRQEGHDFINIGFDRSFNASDRIMYLTSMTWERGIQSGALLMRPCFSAAASLGLQNIGETKVSLYPNPTHGPLSIGGAAADGILRLYDIHGRLVRTARGNNIDCSDLPEGVYLLRLTTCDGLPTARKIIIKH